jgi:hypothetical protein
MSPKKQKSVLFDFSTPPTRGELILDLCAFIGTVIAALIQGWKAADVVWAAWLASLLIGLSFFLILAGRLIIDQSRKDSSEPEEEEEGEQEDPAETEGTDAPSRPLEDNAGSSPGCFGCATAFFFALLGLLGGAGASRWVFGGLACLGLIGGLTYGLSSRRWFGLDPERPGIRTLAAIPSALFLFGFFLGHFGGFHMGHAVFLSSLVPPTVEVSIIADSVIGLRAYLSTFLGVLIVAYWPYVASVAVKNFRVYREALKNSSEGDAMILPYRNVIRIHLLIFVLAPFAMADLGTVVAIIVLFFFFFPIESLIAWYRNKK